LLTSAPTSTLPASWEYLMPKRKERMAGYIRESDPTLADSTTIESQAKAVRIKGEKEGYIYDIAVHEYREAMSAYTVPYMERPQLLKLLEGAKRREFDVVVVSEIRALSRRQVEVFIIYDMLQKYGVRLETVKEKFEDDAMGRLILGLRAAYAEIEREQSYVRMMRGRKDRLEIGHAPNGHPKAAYGYIFIDSLREVKGEYAYNHTIIHTDRYGEEWSEYKVIVYIFTLITQGESLGSIARTLNDLGIPTPNRIARKGEAHWQTCTVRCIARNPIYIGEVWANRYKKVGKSMVIRPKTEWIRLPDAPAIIDQETFLAVQDQLSYNKQNSLRNNHASTEALGLLRAGYIRCGICNGSMTVQHIRDRRTKTDITVYQCRKKTGGNQGLVHNHRTQIHIPVIDKEARTKIIEALQHPEVVRMKVAQWRKDNQPPAIDTASIEETIEKIKKGMQNLYALAEDAPDDEELARITHRMQELGKQKREAEGLLYDIADEEEERAEVEAEIVKFEKWVEQVRPRLTDPSYSPSYEELRLAVRILGVVAIVFPTQGEYPFRANVDITIPGIAAKLTPRSPAHRSSAR